MSSTNLFLQKEAMGKLVDDIIAWYIGTGQFIDWESFSSLLFGLQSSPVQLLPWSLKEAVVDPLPKDWLCKEQVEHMINTGVLQ